jgi:uncharacterized protein YbaP (TraB family)
VGWFRRAALAAAAFLSLASGAQAAPAMWRVTHGDSQVYLFGTLHVLQPKARWRTPLYDRVLAQSGTVWFEADMQSGDPDTLRLLIQRYGSDPDTPLSRKLPASDVDALSRQTDLARIDHLRPWAAALMLSMQPALARGATVERGADLTITRAARSDAKRVRTFETLEDQARMFASLPQGSEVHYLADVIHERARGSRVSFQPSAASLERQWLDGDLARLGPGLVGDLRRQNPSLYDALLKRRNFAWADALTAEMASASGIELVNVGALHMVGDDGLPALLKARGFQVERVQ